MCVGNTDDFRIPLRRISEKFRSETSQSVASNMVDCYYHHYYCHNHRRIYHNNNFPNLFYLPNKKYTCHARAQRVIQILMIDLYCVKSRINSYLYMYMILD